MTRSALLPALGSWHKIGKRRTANNKYFHLLTKGPCVCPGSAGNAWPRYTAASATHQRLAPSGTGAGNGWLGECGQAAVRPEQARETVPSLGRDRRVSAQGDRRGNPPRCGCWILSWCFEPSRPQRITSGLSAGYQHRIDRRLLVTELKISAQHTGQAKGGVHPVSGLRMIGWGESIRLNGVWRVPIFKV